MSAAPLVLDKATIMDFLDVSAEYFAMDTLRDAFVSRISFCEAAHPCNKADPPARILHLGTIRTSGGTTVRSTNLQCRNALTVAVPAAMRAQIHGGSAVQSTQPCGSVAKLDRGGRKQKIGRCRQPTQYQLRTFNVLQMRRSCDWA